MTIKKLIGAALTVCLMAMMAVSTVSAQLPDEFTDSYSRFKPIPEDKLTTEQKEYIKSNSDWGNKYPTDPFEVIALRNPGTDRVLKTWLNFFRAKGGLSEKLQELTILYAGRQWESQAVWWGHSGGARKAGASVAVMNSIAQKKRLPGMTADELALYNFMDELYTKHAVNDATFKATVDQLGEPAVLGIIGLAGFYDYLGMFINVTHIYVPEKFKEKAAIPYPQAK